MFGSCLLTDNKGTFPETESKTTRKDELIERILTRPPSHTLECQAEDQTSASSVRKEQKLTNRSGLQQEVTVFIQSLQRLPNGNRRLWRPEERIGRCWQPDEDEVPR